MLGLCPHLALVYAFLHGVVDHKVFEIGDCFTTADMDKMIAYIGE